MPPLSRASLASIVCPSAPFLAPRLALTSAHVAVFHPFGASRWPCPQRSSFATKRKKRLGKILATDWSEKRRLKEELAREDANTMEQFVTACKSCDVGKIMTIYPTILKSPVLSREDTRRFAQALHTFVRTSPDGIPTQTRAILPFLERFMADIRGGIWPPHPTAFVHLLGIFKEAKYFEEGRDFWLWLSEQDDTYVDQAVYGAAIELLAYRGRDSLQTLEELYQDALKRFPGTFAEYHLSPEAVVPDRTQPTNIPGIPMALLQGILTARILNRDWKNAYLALDTALRLYPTTVPPRFFELFMTERPLSEAYTVFLLACRAGVVFKPNHLTTLLSTKLRTAMPKFSTLYARSLHARTLLLRAQANAIYAYLEAGGTLEAQHISAFLSSVQHLIYIPAAEAYTPKEESIRNLILMTTHKMVATLIQAGLPPSPQVFSALVNLAAKFKIRQLLDVVLIDISNSGIDMGDVGRRVIMKAAGEFKDKALLEKYWAQVSAQAESSGTLIASQDWAAFAKACRRAGYPELFHKELEGLRHAIDSATEQKCTADILVHKDLPPRRPQCELGAEDQEEFVKEFREVERIMNNVAAVVMAGSPLNINTTPFDMFLDVYKEPIASEENLRSVYDELTTDPHQPELPQRDVEGGREKANVALSPTGIPLEELRFQNWVTIVELMADAEATERWFQKQVDKAMETGTALNAVWRPLIFTIKRARQEQTQPETEAGEKQDGGEKEHRLYKPSRLQLHQTVKRLRGPYLAHPPPDKAAYVRTWSRKPENSINLQPNEKLEKDVLARAPFQPTPSLRSLLTVNLRE